MAKTSTGRLSLGFKLSDTDHATAKALIDTLPKGAKVNFIVKAVIEYWNNHGQVIDARDYKKSNNLSSNLNAMTVRDDILEGETQNQILVIIEPGVNKTGKEANLELIKTGLKAFQ